MQSVDDIELMGRLRDVVRARIAAGRITTPAMPEVAIRCLDLIKQPSVTLKDAVRLLERDPGLVAQLVRLANSNAHGRVYVGVSTIEQALARLGLQRLRTLLVEAASERAFDTRDPRVAAPLRGIWTHSRAVAVLARELCPLSPGLDREHAYLAGLLHDVGKPATASAVLEAASTFAHAVRIDITGRDWFKLVSEMHREVGTSIARRWMLPETVTSCLQQCRTFDLKDPKCVANVVRLANAVAQREGYFVGDKPAQNELEQHIVVEK